MKRAIRHRKLSQELVSKRGLKIAKETIKVLSTDQLSNAGSGCPVTSDTTVAPAPTGH